MGSSRNWLFRMNKDFNPCEICECDPCDCFDGCEPPPPPEKKEEKEKIDMEEELWKAWGDK